MQILVDGAPHPLLHAKPLNLSTVLAELDSAMEEKGRVIQSLEIDGKSVALEQIDEDLLGRSPDDIRELRVETEDMRALVVRALDDLAEVISELPAACHSLASLLNSDDKEQALAKFPELSGIWIELMERQRQVLSVLGNPPKKFPPDKSLLVARHQIVSSKLLDASRLGVDRNFPALADVLTHELAVLAEDEALVVATLKNLDDNEG